MSLLATSSRCRHAMLGLRFLFAVALIVAGVGATSCLAANEPQQVGAGEPSTRGVDFNEGWLFYRGEAEDDPVGRGGLAGYLIQAMTPELNAEKWRPTPIPHDWSIEDIPGQRPEGDVGPFQRSANRKDMGHTIGGIGWYTKAFRTQRANPDDRVIVHFDGVAVDSVVYVNNMAAGSHDYAYTPFSIDITDFLEPDGEKNMISVRAENVGDNSRWYIGSGLYRGVKMSVLPAAAIDALSVQIIASDISQASANVSVTGHLATQNKPDGDKTHEVSVAIVDDEGNVVAETELQAVNGEGRFAAEAKVADPRLWSPDSPDMYTAKITLKAAGQVADVAELPFGVRSLEFSAERGFLLNGEPTLLRGCDLHHDNGILGAEAWRAADARRIKLLKESGFNAVRCSHNPPSASFLDACDRLGMMVMDEAFDVWRLPKRPRDYHIHFADRWRRDLRAMMLRDRNRPSVIMWSIGNEITERGRPAGIALAKQLVAAVKEIDSTRPVTNAICEFWDNADLDWSDTPPAFEPLDIGGYNYMAKAYESDHEQFPDRIMVGSESFPVRSYWFWSNVERLPYVIGDFVWTGIDYIGESGLAHNIYDEGEAEKQYRQPWPWFIAWCGDLDIIGDKKPQSQYRDVVWGLSDLEVLVHEPIPDGMVESLSYWGWPKELPHWDWPVSKGTELEVSVYSNCERVGLRLNGEKIAEKPVDENAELKTYFTVPYEPGTLQAYGVRADGTEVTQQLVTTGSPAKLKLIVEPEIEGFADGPRYVRLEVQDAEGRVVPTAEIDIELELSGAQLMAVGTASPTKMASFVQPRINTFRGKALVIVLPEGEASVAASAEGLDGASVTLD
ncbi:MAG: glycoside hydrolase family 2 TIM barrel-domain containing protein [Planctomycetota bacterium]